MKWIWNLDQWYPLIKEDNMWHHHFGDITHILFTNQKPFSDKLTSSVNYIYQLHLSRGMRQGNYCNNLATRVTPFIISKSAIGETVLKTILPHVLEDPVVNNIIDTNNIIVYSHYKKLFSNMPKLYTLGFSLRTEQFLRKYYVFKMQGKWDTCPIQNIMTS